MERSEFKERMVRIDGLILDGKYEDALDLLDSVNWRKLHNVNFLLEGAEKYGRLGKVYDAKELLEIAHERSPMGRMIIYRLAILCANMGEIEEAQAYYQKFIELAPNDNIKFIIKYEICKAQGGDDATLISILEELRANELLEEWAFELACLYRKVGQVDKCISVLDDIILWFGEGPYVEKAFEIKLLYRPLTKDQEIKYQKLSTAGSQIVEIHPGERVARDEFLGNTIRIPEIEESTEKFNTQNLQAEIRKNIEEIMKASEMGEVSDNINAIKGLIEDIPHLQMDEETESIEEKKFNTQRLDEVLKSNFKEYLAEEHDGQISLIETGHERKDEQIEGQMTIDEVMDTWEKTRRAAEAALNDAKERELLQYKKQALARASVVLDRLIESEGGIVEKVDLFSEFGLEKPEFLKESENEIKKSEEESIDSVESETKESEETAGDELTGEPIGSEEQGVANDAGSVISEKEILSTQQTFKIPKLDSVGEPNGIGLEIPVIKVVKDTRDEEDRKKEEALIGTDTDVSDDKADSAEEPREESSREKVSAAEEALKDINNMLQNEIDKLVNEQPSTEDSVREESKPLGNTTTNLPLIDISDIDIENEIPSELTVRQREILSYFANIPGMEIPLIRLLSETSSELEHLGPRDKGHIAIHGRSGSGKTRLAQNIIKVLQDMTGKPAGNVGRIDARKLNEKDIRVLFEKVRGGALIIEDAGELLGDTIVSLTINMESDQSGTLVIVEDTREGMDKLLRMDPRFSRKFTSKVGIPLMTIDELVAFGKIYAAENGFSIDEMGVLALYDRINLCSQNGTAASVTDVKEIVDSAIGSHGEGGSFKGILGIFGNKGSDDSGYPTLQEKDFQAFG